MVWKDPQPAFSETENIHGYRQTLGHKTGYAQTSTYLQSQSLWYYGIGSTRANTNIGGDRTHRKSGGKRDDEWY